MLPSIRDIKFSRLNFNHTCAYINKEYALTWIQEIFNRVKNILQQD